MTKDIFKRIVLDAVKENTNLWVVTESADSLEITFNITGRNNKIEIHPTSKNKEEVIFTIEGRESVTTTMKDIHMAKRYFFSRYEYGLVISYEDNKEILLI